MLSWRNLYTGTPQAKKQPTLPPSPPH